MKIKSLLLGMLACVALVACTNDDIIDKGSGGQQPDEVKANLTLYISSATNSSRAASAEDSEEYNEGTPGESFVSNAAIILKGEAGDEVTRYANAGELNASEGGIFAPTFTVKPGLYKVMVILNPSPSVTAILDDGTIESQYDAILENAETNVADISTSNHFMMVNRDEVTVNVQSNIQSNPTEANVDVERVISKITFISEVPEGGGTPNRYPVEVAVTGYPTVQVNGCQYIDQGRIENLSGLNVAEANVGGSIQTIYVLIESNGTRYFELSGNPPVEGKTVYSLLTTEPTDIHYIVDTAAPPTTSTKTWYVQLDHYALVNLSKSAYTVRHLNNATWTNPKTFGTLNSSYPYIQDPNTLLKNAETDFDSFDGSPYFTNVLADVIDAELEYVADPSTPDYNAYFKALAPANADAQVGTLLSYCFENAVDVSNQNSNLVTGIIFRGQIYDENNRLLPTVYKLNDNYYLDWDAAKAANPSLEENAYDVYNSGKCYYYSSDILHFSEGEYMKHAIMRNNIYALSVEKFNAIGTATINPGPGSSGSDPNAYLKLNGKILDWKVRFNKVTLK